MGATLHRYATDRTFCFLQASQCFLHIAVNLEKSYFCKRGRTGLHFELRASDCDN